MLLKTGNSFFAEMINGIIMEDVSVLRGATASKISYPPIRNV